MPSIKEIGQIYWSHLMFRHNQKHGARTTNCDQLVPPEQLLVTTLCLETGPAMPVSNATCMQSSKLIVPGSLWTSSWTVETLLALVLDMVRKKMPLNSCRAQELHNIDVLLYCLSGKSPWRQKDYFHMLTSLESWEALLLDPSCISAFTEKWWWPIQRFFFKYFVSNSASNLESMLKCLVIKKELVPYAVCNG